MALSRVLLGMAGVTAGVAVLANLPVTWFTTVEKATLIQLAGAKLQTIDEAKRNFTKTFYGPKERWFPLAGILRFNVLRNGYRAYSKGIPGNVKGEGRLLGAVYLIGKGNEGLIYQHQEKEFGDIVKLEDLRKALQKIKKQ
ncbi:hypothetical protein FSP39_012944 [Pinctada imbricata]|uniref:Peroxiredoxin-like 2A n=1 Tax=Pinctada imbricata TaxID=66713 RepID=A0AA88XYR6_PINIB|nr:hypothetical protein FSP39_012944 [Pinctada imbricata]